MYQPDQIDWRIIRQLMQDGRLSSAELSRILGDVSARTITNRIDTLTQEGIINIRSIVNPDKVGYGVLADVFVEVEPEKLREIADKLAEYPQISYLALATGDKDIILSIRSMNIDELYNFVIEEIGKIPGIHQTKTYLLPVNLKDITSWIPPEVDHDQD